MLLLGLTRIGSPSVSARTPENTTVVRVSLARYPHGGVKTYYKLAIMPAWSDVGVCPVAVARHSYTFRIGDLETQWRPKEKSHLM